MEIENFVDVNHVNDVAMKLTKQYWKLSFVVCVIYLVLTFTGQRYMASRKPFDLRGRLVMWNLMLTTFSVTCAYISVVDLISVWKNEGLYAVVCVTFPVSSRPGMWLTGFIFAISKLIELGDTSFIILRKQPLIFLHWYHHVTVLLHCFYIFGNKVSLGRVFGTMNSIVHSVMYFYYALKAMRVKMSRSIAMSITVLQLSQMVIGLFVNYYAYNVLIREEKCDTDFWDINVSLFMYFTYLLLFINLFYNSYLKKSEKVIEKRD